LKQKVPKRGFLFLVHGEEFAWNSLEREIIKWEWYFRIFASAIKIPGIY